MNVIYEDEALHELFLTGQTKDSKYKKLCRDAKFIRSYVKVVMLLKSALKTNELKQYSYLHYEKLKGVAKSSVRIMNGRVERLLFRELENGIEVSLIEIDDTHYGQK